MKHVISFLRSPLGYILNLVATLGTKLPANIETKLCGAWLCGLCETFCAHDGVQDDVLF